MRILAERARLLEPSGTLSIRDKVNELRREGIDVFGFSNRPMPPIAAVDAARIALGESWSASYADTRGLLALRELIAARSSRSLGRKVDPESEVLITVGAKEALFAFLMTTIAAGDQVLVLDPAWVSYESCVRLAGGEMRRVPLRFDTKAFYLDVREIRRSLTSRTKVLILNTPHNPTGFVLARDEIREIADLAEEADLFVLADECYEHYVYDGVRHYSVGSMPRMFERTVTISTMSKVFNMYGWRIGWAIGPSKLVENMLNVHQNTVSCATTFAQAGAVGLLSMNENDLSKTINETVSTFGAARVRLVQELNGIEGVTCHLPQGGYQAFPSISALKRSSAEVAEVLLSRGRIYAVPGSAFGPSGEGFIRIGFTCTLEDVATGVERIRGAFRAFSKREV